MCACRCGCSPPCLSLSVFVTCAPVCVVLLPSAASFLGSYAADDASSDDEGMAGRRKTKKKGGYGSDDDLWDDLAGKTADTTKVQPACTARGRAVAWCCVMRQPHPNLTHAPRDTTIRDCRTLLCRLVCVGLVFATLGSMTCRPCVVTLSLVVRAFLAGCLLPVVP